MYKILENTSHFYNNGRVVLVIDSMSVDWEKSKQNTAGVGKQMSH